MSLNWELKGSPIVDELLSEENWEKTQGMIFSTMAVGIGHLTEKTVSEFAVRLTIFSQLFNLPEVTLEEVQRYIGLSTNVTYETRSAWSKSIINRRYDELTYSVNYALRSENQ